MVMREVMINRKPAPAKAGALALAAAILALAIAVPVAHAGSILTQGQLNAELGTSCAAQGKTAPCITPTQMSDLVTTAVPLVSSGIAAAGTSQGTATPLAGQISDVTTVPVGAGVVLPAAVAGQLNLVCNDAANQLQLLVYPASGASIGTLATNAPQTVLAGQCGQFTALSATAWKATFSSAPAAAGFYVSASGSDNNPGTLALPFLTLGKCQTAMQGSSSIKTCYLRAGTYSLTASSDPCGIGGAATEAIALGPSDAGETWAVYPPDGYGAAVLDGGATTLDNNGSPTNGVGAAFCANTNASTAPGVTFNGLTFARFGHAGVWAGSASATVPATITFTNNTCHDFTGWGFEVGNCVRVANSPNGVISHNYIYNMQGPGIDTAVKAGPSTGGQTNLSIDHNFVQNTCINTGTGTAGGNPGDCGAIMTADTATGSGVSTNVSVKFNYVRDVFSRNNGTFTGASQGTGIYMDDSTANVTATGNIVTGFKGTCIFYHENLNNVVTGNICDLSTPAGGGSAPIVYINQAKTISTDPTRGQTGLTFQNNVVVCSPASGNCGNTTFDSYTSFSGLFDPPDGPTNSNNSYWNYNGGSVNNSCGNFHGPACHGSPPADTNPTTENPQISCWAATIASNSPIFSPPVSFPALPAGWGTPGFWGYPGFTIPQTGTAPSWPHAC
jgi:hypothetical protein